VKSRTLLFAMVLVLASGGLLSEAAKGAGEVTLGIGGVWPQGSFAAYGDPGPHFLARGELEIPGFPAAAGWVGLGFTLFSSESFRTDATVEDITIPLEETTSQSAFSFHVGIQLGSSSRQAFFRPRAAVGVGFYQFTTNVELKRTDWHDDEEPLYSENLDSQFRFGWRGVLGADFYFTSKWGVSFDLLYDHVLDLNRIEGDDQVKRTSRFQGFSVGVVFPFGFDQGTPAEQPAAHPALIRRLSN
jgi:hypothetical protein